MHTEPFLNHRRLRWAATTVGPALAAVAILLRSPTVSLGAPSYAAAVLNEVPIAYYRFGEVATAVQTFQYTGAPQTYTVPPGVTRLRIEANGAQGGDGATGGNSSAGGAGGLGSRVSGILNVTPGQVLTLVVGGRGGTPTGGYNGGGNGGSQNAGGGGGASDVRLGGTGVANRILVAGGGGGGGRGGCEPNTVNGGNGGGPNGLNGANSPSGGGGFGGNGATGGAAGIGCAGFLGSPGTNATSEVGGNGGAGQACCCFGAGSIPGGGGGGGGYIGGGGGGGGSAGTTGCSGNDKGGGGGGAGGSNYVDPMFSSATSSYGQNAGDGSITISVLSSVPYVPVDTRFYSFTGTSQTYVVPPGITRLLIQANGAQGGDGAAGGNASAGGKGGLGSRATGILPVTPGQVLTLFVGGRGTTPLGGYNGGGNGGSQNAGGGGGASDVRLGGTGVANRILVAGGGGGGGRGGCEPNTVNGGNGGGANGANGANSPSGGGGFGATGATGGAAGLGCASFLGSPGTNATSEVGGNGGAGQTCCCFDAGSVPGGGGGGGGYVGGGGGGGGSAGNTSCQGNDKGGGGGGAGGSSYIDAMFISGTSTFSANEGDGSIIITALQPLSFGYTGAPQTFTVPPGVTRLLIEAYGAQGGDGATGGNASAGGTGGLGSRASGVLDVTPGQVLTLFVGGRGGTPTGGYNGGGNGGSQNAGGGGGASDVRLGGVGVANRILVAGGGGGGGRGGCEPNTVNGGNGGGANGANGANSPTGGGGFGATGATGGAPGIGCANFLGRPGTNATSEIGGNGGAGQTCCCFGAGSVPGGGGGGGGYIGGGGGGGGSAGSTVCSGNDKGGGGGGAGGSSYISAIFSSGSSAFSQNAGDGVIHITIVDYTPVTPNSGLLGNLADGLVQGGAVQTVPGPRPPAYPGFEPANVALDLDGLDDAVRTISSLLDSRPRFTIMGWLRRGGPQAARAGLFGQNDFVEFGYFNDSTLQVSTASSLSVANPFPNLAWGHVALVQDGTSGTMSLYTNGQLAATGPSTMPPNNAFTFNIGGGGIFDAAGNYFRGQIDEVAVFDRALSAEKICALYHTAAPLQLQHAMVGGQLTLTWRCGTLQYTDELPGDGSPPVWTDLPAAVSPHLITPGAPKRYYRIRL